MTLLFFSALSWSSLALFGKSWAVGYSLTILAVLLGLVPVVFPSSNKKKRRGA